MGVFFRPDARPLPDAKLAAKERRAAWKAWAMGDILPSASAALAGAALWVCLEWGRGWLIPGFGWNNLGVALYGNPLAQWAEYFWRDGAGLYSGRLFRLALACLPPGRNHDCP